MLASARALNSVGGSDLPHAARQHVVSCNNIPFGIRSGAASGCIATPKQHLVAKLRRVSCNYRQADEAQAPVPPTTDSPKPSAVLAPAAQPPTARAQLKVIGLGLRGISAVNRLIGSGSLPEAEFWALDSDKRVLSSADASTHVLEVGPGDDASLGQADLVALSGGMPNPAAPEAPDGHAGAVFVLGSAFGSPGGAPMLLQLVRHLRRQGYFVAAALTRPFEFEGARRLEAADTLISTMEEVAHLVVVIAQGVLTRASAELTMGQAQAIADNTLVYTVQSTLWALRAPEILKVSHGAFLWHGRDLRNIRRPLFPPMMNLLSCPGHATLGRGQAALPLPLLQQAGLASALSTLAEDAVKAASESPFLDNKLESATGVLCVLRVPPSALGVASVGNSRPGSSNANQGGPLVADNHKEYALRSAVQVAAMTVRELVGPHCHDIIVCPQLCHDLESGPEASAARPSAPASTEGAAATDPPAAGTMEASAAEPAQQQPARLVRVEVSLLVLERVDEAAEPKAIAGQKGLPEASSRGAASAGLPAAPAPTAATARDRITSVMGTRTPAAPRRLPPPGAPTTASSYFSGQSQQPATSSASTSPISTQPAWAGGMDAGMVGRAAATTPTSTSATSSSAVTPGVTAGNPSSATLSPASSAAAAAVAESNRARKQARLAAMSALAGGTATGISGNVQAGAGAYNQSVGGARGGHAGTAHSSAWGGAVSARGYPQQQQPLQHQAQQVPTPPAPEVDAARPAGSGATFGLQQIPRLAESLVTSLVAQSLDLPPQAARWRHQQRVPPSHGRGPAPSVFHLPKVDADLHDVDDSWLDGQSDGLGRGLQQLIMGMRLPGLAPGDGNGPVGAVGPAVVRNRVAGMLDLERKDLWEGPDGAA